MPEETRRRILYYSEGWGLGGIEAYVMSVVAAMDREHYSFDIFCTHDWDTSYDAAIEAAGGRRLTVFHGHKPPLPVRLAASTMAFRRLLANQQYDIVHINTMNGVGFIYARIAEKAGVPVRIVHSHNADFGAGSRRIKSVAHRLGKRLWGPSASARLACSEDAGHYLYDALPFTLIRNCVDTTRFRYNTDTRQEVRNELGIGAQTLLFGTVGRLAEAKNPVFQVDVLRCLRDRGEDARLLLVGSGPLEDDILDRAHELGVSDNVHLLGARTDVERYYNALDVFSMPSLFEGAPFTPIEAMSTGLPCLLSTRIPRYDFDSSFIVCADNDNPCAWAEKITQLRSAWLGVDRSAGIEEVNRIGYGIDAAWAQIAPFYK